MFFYFFFCVSSVLTHIPKKSLETTPSRSLDYSRISRKAAIESTSPSATPNHTNAIRFLRFAGVTFTTRSIVTVSRSTKRCMTVSLRSWMRIPPR